ncbi:MAG: cytochrome c [Verrucomicrobiales bacterium]|nr:cytochrome c [Verrucomicrobiales bacterium]
MAFSRAILFALPVLVTALVNAGEPPVIQGVHEGDDAVLVGRVLLSELNCTACHAGGIPSKGAPELGQAKSRIHPAYLEAFIADPHGTKPGTTMPNLLGHLPMEERAAAARALSHFIRSLDGPDFETATIQPEAVARGRNLYHKVGCAACHDPEGKSLPDSSPLIGMADKYSPTSLTAFLENPLAVRRGGRMPDLRLTHWEAADLAHYLLRDQKPKANPPHDPAQAGKGRILFNQLGCAQCHQPGEPKTGFAMPLTALAPAKSCPTADFALSPLPRSQLTAARKVLDVPVDPATDLQLSLIRLNCVACHERDGRGGPAAARDPFFTTSNLNLGEQARIPPALDGVGAKLLPQWLLKVLVSGASVRPYMDTRMPKFGPGNVEELPPLFGQLDSLPPAPMRRIQDEKVAREAGGDLVGDKKLGCVACHTFNGESATTLAAVEMTTLTERLQENWFHLYLRNPQQFHPTTIMPSFWPGGKAVRPEVLDGDPAHQIDAIWQFLSRGREARTPSGIRREPIEYGPGSGEAVMLRRQYQGIGKRGIGVGYPSGINLSFDAAQMRLGSLWKGDFGEMSGVWRGQGSGNVGERSRDVVRFPVGPAFAQLESLETPWPVLEQAQKAPGFQFQGYTLDNRQRPTFLYRFDGLEISDQWVDQPDGPSLVRTLQLSQASPEQLYFRLAADPELKAGVAANTFLLPRGLILKPHFAGMLRPAGENTELLVPLEGRSSLVIEYTFHHE